MVPLQNSVGNGARCIAKFIKQKQLSNKNEFKLFTHHKITQVRLDPDELVTVEVPEPVFEPALIPFLAENNTSPYSLSINGNDIQFYVANIGNPHAVIITDKIDTRMVNVIGKELSVNSHFPQGVNVGFMQVLSTNHIQLQVYERGAGITLACGSGAIAAAAVGRKLGLLQEQTRVTQTGGELWISWQGTGSPIYMRGPAEFVYEGRLFISSLTE